METGQYFDKWGLSGRFSGWMGIGTAMRLVDYQDVVATGVQRFALSRKRLTEQPKRTLPLNEVDRRNQAGKMRPGIDVDAPLTPQPLHQVAINDAELQGPRAGEKGIQWCPLWCPVVPKMVPNGSHRNGCRSHQIALEEPASPAKTAIRRSPQVLTRPGDIAPIGAKLHRLAPKKRAMGGKYPRQESNLQPSAPEADALSNWATGT